MSRIDRTRPKQDAACSVCDTPLFTPIERPGTSIVDLSPINGARRCNVLLLSGNTTHFSLCGSCELTPDIWPAVWEKAKRRMAQQCESNPQPSHKKMLWLFNQEIPLGVLASRQWSEVQ